MRASSAEPPLFPSRPPSLRWRHRRISRVLFNALLAGTAIFWTLVFALWVTERLRPYRVPTGAMSPAIKSGDQIIAEGATFLFREPRRGEIVAFKTIGIADIGEDTTYVKRLVGLPGDRVQISDGHLFVNDEPLILRNKAGRISYTTYDRSKYLSSPDETFAVPPAHYFVLGDNSPQSADSRFWGFVPAENVRSRVVWCYWPLSRFGPVQ